MAKSKMTVLAEMFDRAYGWVPDFDDLFDEEGFYIFAFTITIASILVCFLLSRKITLHESNF